MALGMDSWEGSPTSCLPPGSGLGGRASQAAASWVRKEEKSHILWWLYPLGSVPETLVTEQTVKPSGDRGRDLAAGAQRGGPGPGEKPENRPQDLPQAPLTCSFLRCFRKSLGWKREQRELTHLWGLQVHPRGAQGSEREGRGGEESGPRTGLQRLRSENSCPEQ